MFTACPHCQFLVARDPHSGATPVDCPRCGKPLVMAGDTPASAPSLATLLHAVPPPEAVAAVDVQETLEETADMPSTASRAVPAPVEQAISEDGPATETDTAAEDDTATAADAPLPDIVPVTATEAARPAPRPAQKATGPRFLHHARTTPVHARRARLQWAAVIALSLLLCVQVVIADRARLAMQAGWRPVVMALCGVFRCDVPTWREPAAFTMLSRDVRPLLDMPGTLQAQATFRNEARWAQAWPVILLTLKDADGRTLGARALQPADYLQEGEMANAIGPGQSAQMAVRIREPSASVVAFSFDFR